MFFVKGKVHILNRMPQLKKKKGNIVFFLFLLFCFACLFVGFLVYFLVLKKKTTESNPTNKPDEKNTNSGTTPSPTESATTDEPPIRLHNMPPTPRSEANKELQKFDSSQNWLTCGPGTCELIMH